MIKTVPAVTMEVVTGFGEIRSAQTLLAYLRTTGVGCDWVDARQVLVVKSESEGLGEKGSTSTTGVAPLWTPDDGEDGGLVGRAERCLRRRRLQSRVVRPRVHGLRGHDGGRRAHDAQAVRLGLLRHDLRALVAGVARHDVEEHGRRLHRGPAARAGGLPDRVPEA